MSETETSIDEIFHQAAQRSATQMLKDIDRLEARIKKLEAGLEPFAKCARVFDPDMISGTMVRRGIWQSWPRTDNGKYTDYHLTVEHLQTARALLTPAHEKGGE